MAERFPLLEQMRAQRDERERDVMVPLVLLVREKEDQLLAAWGAVQQMGKENRDLKKLLTTGMWDRIKDKIELDLSRALRMAIHEAVNVAAARQPEFDRYFVEIKIPADLRDHHPQSIEHAILEKFMTQYSLEIDLHEEFRGPLALDELVPVEPKIMHRLEVTVPSLSYTHMICDLHSRNPGA